jgi:hypothetical protein
MSTFETRNHLVWDQHSSNAPDDIRRLRALWAAVANDSLFDAARQFKAWAEQQKRPEPPPMEKYASLFWVMSDDDHVGSFKWITEFVFGLDHIRCRQAWRANIRSLIKRAEECESQEIKPCSSPESSPPPSGRASKSAAPTKSGSAPKSKGKPSSAPSTARANRPAPTPRHSANQLGE